MKPQNRKKISIRGLFWPGKFLQKSSLKASTSASSIDKLNSIKNNQSKSCLHIQKWVQQGDPFKTAQAKNTARAK